MRIVAPFSPAAASGWRKEAASRMLCVTVRLSRERFLAIPIVYQQTVQTTIFPVCQQMEHDSQRLAPRKANAMTAGSLDSDASLCRRVGRRHHHGERERVQEVVLRRAERCGSRVAASRWLRPFNSRRGHPLGEAGDDKARRRRTCSRPARGAIADSFAEAPAGANPEGQAQSTLPPLSRAGEKAVPRASCCPRPGVDSPLRGRHSQPC